MTNEKVQNIYRFLSTIRLNAISEREVRNSLINLYLALAPKVKEIDSRLSETQKCYFEGKEKEIEKHNRLVNAIRSEQDPEKREALVSKIDPSLNAIVVECNANIEEYLKSECEVTIPKIDRLAFVDAMEGSDTDLTLATFSDLEEIFETT